MQAYGLGAVGLETFGDSETVGDAETVTDRETVVGPESVAVPETVTVVIHGGFASCKTARLLSLRAKREILRSEDASRQG